MSFVSELERELVEAARARQRRRLARFDFGGVVVLAAACASSLLVALVVLTLVGHGPRPGAGSGPRSTGAIPPAAARLAAKLSILRRPQTAADRSLPDRVARQAAEGSYIPGLTRLAVSTPGTRAFIVVSTPDPGNIPLTREWPLALGDRVSLVVIAHGEIDTSQPVPAAGLGALDTLVSRWVVATVVPDGVARVRFTLLGHKRLPGHRLSTVTVDAHASGNVALAPPAGGFVPSKVQWYAADGATLSTPDTAAPSWVMPAGKTNLLPAPAAFAARLRSAFALFADGPWSHAGLTVSRPPVDDIPTWIRASTIPSPGPAGFVATTLYVRSTLQILTSAGLEAWVVPISGGFCVYGALGGGCSASRGGPLVSGAWGLIMLPDGTSDEVGVVPKTNTSVTVIKNSGARWHIPVRDGVVVFTSIGVMQVDYKGADGRPSYWH